MSYRFFFRKTFSEKHCFNLSFPSHFISSSFPLRPSTSASPPHRCASSSWVINSNESDVEFNYSGCKTTRRNQITVAVLLL
ncbi:hypothetical protein ES288_D03G046100v1 [Gossypium darwinii]|uniref:Uncharacterized protein n=1 Tax=Gossypium darwinii TaxID=34276 RepID=A0A5D2D3V1_GOSDA|nr:hypothetical protein ES288_D03G046100v1 [Gossypium darwinii]TYG75620.1 hypothetical protein ES288_D03G046100v1 [Gossypium darwinii]